MFDFSFGELLLIGLVAILVVGPKDMPLVLRAIGRWMGQFKSLADEFRSGFKSALHEMDLAEEAKFIRDEQGNLQRVYDISDFMDEHNRTMKPLSDNEKKTI